MSDGDDPVVEAQALRRRIIAVREDQVFTKRWVIAGFLVLLVPVVATLGLVVGVTADTNRAVERQVLPLQQRNTELEDAVAVQEDLLRQSTDAIVLLLDTLQANGITTPEIIIRPPEDEGD